MSTNRGRTHSLAVIFGIEWPTVLVWALCWLFWFLLCSNYAAIPPLIFILAGGLTAGWHASFQHEAIHGHPTQSERINRFMASPSMALWLPFEDYRLSHLAHHVNENLTDPDRDPESYYIWKAQWEAMGGWRRALMGLSNTLVGRLSVGASLMILKCIISHTRLLLSGDRKTWKIMMRHWAFSLPFTALALFYFQVPWWAYVLGFQFGPAVCMSLRSFLEHEAADGVGRRTAIVYDSLLPPTAWFTGPFSLLFLNNNLHAAHHLEPRLAWYQLPRYVHENHDALVAWNQGNCFASYGEVAARFAVKAKEPVAHPGFSTDV